MKHDAEGTAASYLHGEIKGRRRVRFEQHMVECEECWREVRLGRSGRALAESARELAPQATREKVRAVIAAFPSPPRRRLPRRRAAFLGMVALSLALAGVTYVEVREVHQPAVIEAILTDYRRAISPRSIEKRDLPRKVGDLTYVGTYAATLEGLETTGHVYRSGSDQKVVVYQARTTFPILRGAEHSADRRTWSAEIGGAVLFCADQPVPSLVVGDHAQQVTLVAGQLGLR